MSTVRRLALIAGLLLVVLAGAVWRLVLDTAFVPEPKLPGTVERLELEWEGRTRSYGVYVPARPLSSPPIVFVLHGSMGDGEGARQMMAFEFDELAEEHGFLAIYPDGFERHFNGCRKAGPYSANELGVDDVGFFRAIVDEHVKTHGAARDRVFATGVSNGGHMAIRLALEAPDLVRAVAPIAAALPREDNLGCAPVDPGEHAVGMLLINGTDDPMNPWEGGTVALYGVWGNRGEVHSTEETIEFFAHRAGHAGPPEIEDLPDVRDDDSSHVRRHVWRTAGRPDVALLGVIGGGHTIPHPTMRWPRIIGPTNADIDGPRTIWAFFARS